MTEAVLKAGANEHSANEHSHFRALNVQYSTLNAQCSSKVSVTPLKIGSLHFAPTILKSFLATLRKCMSILPHTASNLFLCKKCLEENISSQHLHNLSGYHKGLGPEKERIRNAGYQM